jgi:hypothetical protein
MKWAGHVARTKEKRNAYRMLVLVEKPERKRPLGRTAALEINRPIILFNFVRKKSIWP